MSDCRTCKYNTYIDIVPATDWVDCLHPITFAKTPKWERGDPAMVNYRTGDVPVSQIYNLTECPTYESAADWPSSSPLAKVTK